MFAIRTCLAWLCMLVAASCASEEVAFTISADCVPPQIGVPPQNLAEDLLEGYNYQCYEVANKALRWHTTDGIPEGMLSFSDVDMSVLLGQLKTYGMQMIFFIAPLGGFVIFSTIYCAIWSCGMSRCCAENRKCCGKCCANPPRCTEGNCEYLLFLLIIAAGAAVVGLALKGLASNTEQNQAVEQVGQSFGLMQSWGNATLARTASLDDDFGDVINSTNNLVSTLGSLRTTEIKADAESAANDVLAGMNGAATAVRGLSSNLTALTAQIDNMTVSFSASTATFNGYRGKVMLFAWIGLCGLMMWGILISILRQFAPEKTEHCFCTTMFSLIGFLYLVVMFILGIVCIVLALLTILLGDVCQNPDFHFASIISSMTESDESAAGDDDGGGGGLALGTDSFVYYLECDTDSSVVNPFNVQVEDTAELIYDAAAGTSELGDIFAAKESEVLQSLQDCQDAVPAQDCSSAQVAHDNFFVDKGNIDADLDGLAAAMESLKETVVGSQAATITSAAEIVVPNQGMSDGLFSITQCYQMNSRYQAMVNVFCDDVFSSIATTLEFLIVALVLMVLVEWLKRLARPYNGEYDLAKVMPEGGDKWALASGRDEY